MKKIVLVLIILCVPAFLFADFQIGATALYNDLLWTEDGIDTPTFDSSNFTFGADARLKFLFLQASAMALYTGPEVDEAELTLEYPYIDVFLDGGVAIDLLSLIRVGLGVGPSLRVEIGSEETDPVDLGLNAKASAELMLGDISLALNYLLMLDFDGENPDSVLDTDKSTGLFGVSVLFSLF